MDHLATEGTEGQDLERVSRNYLSAWKIALGQAPVCLSHLLPKTLKWPMEKSLQVPLTLQWPTLRFSWAGPVLFFLSL